MSRGAKQGDDVYVALLRGINVGGKNKLPMKDLTAMLEGAGFRDVRTYIQSGNVVFRSGSVRAARAPELIGQGVARRFGFRPPVVMRTARALRTIARGNPFLRAGVDTAALHVVFLAEPPSPERIAALDPGRSPPDEFAVRGSEIYLRCPNGVARTKLSNAYFDATLATTSTVRNWKTVLALAELSAGA